MTIDAERFPKWLDQTDLPVAVPRILQESMCDYFQMLWKTPGMLSPTAVVAVDMTPFKVGCRLPFSGGENPGAGCCFFCFSIVSVYSMEIIIN